VWKAAHQSRPAEGALHAGARRRRRSCRKAPAALRSPLSEIRERAPKPGGRRGDGDIASQSTGEHSRENVAEGRGAKGTVALPQAQRRGRGQSAAAACFMFEFWSGTG
jgi:hypothetical protein